MVKLITHIFHEANSQMYINANVKLRVLCFYLVSFYFMNRILLYVYNFQ